MIFAFGRMWKFIVRRITPTEGERLQGFPDGHTIASFKEADLTDELLDRFIEIHYNWDCMTKSDETSPKRKSRDAMRKWLLDISSESTCPDSPRFKTIGNSMQVNVMEWIGLKIARADERLNDIEKPS